jgi:hypothetical protein
VWIWARTAKLINRDRRRDLADRSIAAFARATTEKM